MAERRMFAKTIIDSDAFIDMPLSTQALYFHLSMRADDDGFINNAKKIQRMIGASDDDLKVLIAKMFLIPFESGIMVIKHWRIHNYIRNDRYKETAYLDEKSMLKLKENNAYSLESDALNVVGIPMVDQVDTDCKPNGYHLDTQVRLGKDRIGKDSIKESMPDESGTHAPKNASDAKDKESKRKYGQYTHVRLKDSEYKKLEDEYGYEMACKCITFLDEYIEMKGYKAKSHYLCIKKWVVDAVKERQAKEKKNGQSYTDGLVHNHYAKRDIDYDNLEKQLLS